jgi:hypothetical protein
MEQPFYQILKDTAHADMTEEREVLFANAVHPQLICSR